MNLDYLFLDEYYLVKGLNFGIETPHVRYDIVLEKIMKAGVLSQAIFQLSSRDNYYHEEITIARLYEHILPQEEIFKAEAMLVNNDSDLALRLLYDPRIILVE